MEKFDRGVFESIVDHIVVGGYDEEGREDPLLLTIVFKTGGNILIDGTQYRPRRLNASSKNEPSELCENTITGATGLLQINQQSARGDGSIATKLESLEILKFRHSYDRCLFDLTKRTGRRKRLNKEFTVSVVVDLVSGNTI